MIQRLILPNWPGAAEQSIDAPSRNFLDQLQDYRQRIRPALGVARGSQQQVHMIGHHDRRVENTALSIVVPAMLKNKVACHGRKRLADQLSKCHKVCPVSFLIMRQPPSILVFVSQRRGLGHEPHWIAATRRLSVMPAHRISSVLCSCGRTCVERTLLSAAFGVDLGLAFGFASGQLRKYRTNQQQPQSQKRRTRVSAPHKCGRVGSCRH
jgi:hypothetical protein